MNSPDLFFRYLVSNFNIEIGNDDRSKWHPGDAALAFALQAIEDDQVMKDETQYGYPLG